MFIIDKRLKLLKKDVKELNKRCYSNISFRINANKIQCDTIQEGLIDNGNNVDLIEARKKCQLEYLELRDMEHKKLELIG